MIALASLLTLVLCGQVSPGALAGEPGDAAGDPMAGAAQRQVLVMLRLAPQQFRPDGSYSGGYMNDGTRAARLAGRVGAGTRRVSRSR